jgi:RHS repeat-associated protein
MGGVGQGDEDLSYYGDGYLDMKTSLWLNVDPWRRKYPSILPYCYAMNNPINAIDPDGRLSYLVTDNIQAMEVIPAIGTV